MTDEKDKCFCHACTHGMDVLIVHDMVFGPFDEFMGFGMIVCDKCGNKRCPHATDHRHECTGSNEPGQDGSVY